MTPRGPQRLTPEQAEMLHEVETMAAHAGVAEQAVKASAVRAVAAGVSRIAVGRACGRNDDTVARWVKEYKKER